jgi:hypothetical protein
MDLAMMAAARRHGTNYEAFATTDTDNKIHIGGKGVGRLLWLDCLRDIEVVHRL